MNTKNIILSICTFGLLGSMPFSMNAQINKEQPAAVHVIPDSLQQESVILILDSRKMELMRNVQQDEIYFIDKTHRIIRLQDAAAVEGFNKFVLNEGYQNAISNIQARTIKKNGSVQDIDVSKLKTSKNEYGNTQYHIAFENVSPGDEIELYYEEKKPLRIFGSEIYQISIPTLEARFSLTTPEAITYEGKSYNGFPEPEKTIQDGLVTLTAIQKNIPAIKEEIYSDPKIHAQRIDYKISYSNNSVGRIYTWNDLAKALNELFYNHADKELKAAKKLIADAKVDTKAPHKKQVIQLEQYIKTNIVMNEDLSDEYMDVVSAINNKSTNEKGITRLFTACLSILNIKHEVGVTSNKFENILDEKFENWNILEHYLIYILDDKEVLLPGFMNIRYPATVPFLENNKAIFSKRLTHGNTTTAISNIRTLPVSDYTKNIHNIYANISFDANDFTQEIELTHAMNGLSAVGLREAVTMVPKDKEKQLLMQVISLPELESEILQYDFVNKGFEHYSTNLPLEMKATLKLDHLVEKAGNKYLFKLGDIIGPQQEMYKSEKRQLPIAIPSAHRLYREIVINIPAGYKVSNPESTIINKDFGKDKYGFISSYKIDGNKMTVYLDEYYAQIEYDKAEIDDFRSVINAAADFNKVTLVFEKL